MKTDSGVTADCTGLEIGEYVNKKEKVIYTGLSLNHGGLLMAKVNWPLFLVLFVRRFQQHVPVLLKFLNV